jgi:hypothetical protein|nr:hypothetical protein [uncultured Comamonas sp.]
MRTLEVGEGILFHYDSDVETGDVIIETPQGEIRLQGAHILQFVATAFVVPAKIALHEELGTDSEKTINGLRQASPKELLLGVV